VLDVLNQQALAAGYVDLSTEFEVVCGTDRKRTQFVTDPVVACNIKALLMHNMEVRAMHRMHRIACMYLRCGLGSCRVCVRCLSAGVESKNRCRGVFKSHGCCGANLVTRAESRCSARCSSYVMPGT